jgi:chorismate dehydratase
MNRVRLGAVGYLNARPLVYGLERSTRFELRFDVPSRCADLLHQDRIDIGLIPSIEYLRIPSGAGHHEGDGYRIVPDLAIASRGPVASVALYTTRPVTEVRAIAMDTSSRTSVALVRVLCARRFGIEPALEPHGPDLASMLESCDAALLIGDNALFQHDGQSTAHAPPLTVQKIDLGEVWTAMTGLPFVWAFWAGRPDRLTGDDMQVLRQARDAGVAAPEVIARQYLEGYPERQAAGARYLRDNIKYHLGPDERAGLELFYRYAAEAGVVNAAEPLRFY